jgi:hypothetical protein
MDLLWTLAVILLVLWLLGLVTSYSFKAAGLSSRRVRSNVRVESLPF